jgi:nitroreductase
MAGLPNPLDSRKTQFPIESIFVRRWSPRAMSGETLTEMEIGSLFEAARWAPSTFNEQEWRFLYAKKGGAHFQTFFKLLMEANQVWCKSAAMLVVIASKKTFTRNGNPNPVHTFDAGAAFENLALQGAAMGLVVHGMAGFDYEKARKELRIPDDFKVEAMIAVGRPGDPDQLSAELKSRETPTDRKPVAEIAKEGLFAF